MRVVGGKFRGRTLTGPSTEAIRPTADRLRESIFNILAHAYGDPVTGARVLDLFAGTGALGLEAVSRGACEAVLVERDPALAAALRTIAAKLPGGERVHVAHEDALAWLRRAPGPFDLAFVDPPFAAGLWTPVLAALEPHLADDAWLYVESPADAAPDPGAGWRLHREGRTRDVRYALLRRATAGG